MNVHFPESAHARSSNSIIDMSVSPTKGIIPQPQRVEGRKIIPYRDSEPAVPPYVEKLALKSQVSNSPFLKHSGQAMTLNPFPRGSNPTGTILTGITRRKRIPGVQPPAAHLRSLTLWVILMSPAVLPPPLG